MTMQPETVRVLLVDDHPLMRKGLRTLLESDPDLTVIGEAEDGEAAIEQVRALTPDIVVMDISMPKLNGIESTKRILAEVPATRIIAMSIHAEKHFVDNMISAGAMGYVLKDSAPEELVHCIHTVMRGEAFLSSSILGDVVSAYRESINEAADGDPAKSNDNSVMPLRLTKLHSPKIPEDEVPRKILLEQLDREKVHPLILVSAPAGYGKSILIGSWLEHCDWPSVWFSLEPDDSNLRQFLRYFIIAVRGNFASACEKSLELVEAPSLPSVETLTTTLANDLDAIDQPFILVLDDFHHIDSNSQVNSLLQKLLDVPPIPLHLVIITRRDPPLALNTLRASGQMTDIRMTELRFSQAEVRMLIEKSLNISMSDDVIANLENALEGWAVGLRLVILASRQMEKPAEFLRGLRGGVQQTQEYLVQEVVQKQSPFLQDWLLKSAVFDRFSLSLCEKVLGESVQVNANNEQTGMMDGEKFINSLIQENLFIIPLDGQGTWFRYHHLFQKLMENEMRQRFSAGEIAELHLKVSAWFEQQGNIDEAIQHALKAGDTMHAAQIVEKHYHEALNQDAWFVLDNWLEKLPADVRSQRPGLLLVKAATALFRQQLPQLLQAIELLESICMDHAVNDEAQVEMDFYNACLHFWDGSITQSEVEFESILQRFSDKQIILHAEALGYLGFSRLMNGKQALAIEGLNTQILKAEHLVMVRLIGSLCQVELLAGDLHQLRFNASRMREQASHGSNHYLDLWNQYFQGIVMLHDMQLEEATGHLEAVVEHRYHMDARAAIDAMAGLALTQQMLQQPQSATATVQQMLQFAVELNDPEQMHIAQSCEARINLLQGNVTKAFVWVQSVMQPSVSVNVFSLFTWLEVPEITQVRVLIMEGSADSLRQAIVMLEQMKALSESFHLNCQVIEITLLQALAYDKQGMSDRVFTLFAEAVARAETGGWLRPFAEIMHTSDLPQRFVQTKGDTPFLQRIMAVSGQANPMPGESPDGAVLPGLESVAKTNGLLEPLTNRELDILELLTKHLQNKEIASHLFVSVETVKTHLKHLYQKLGVNNRREAATVADEILRKSRSDS